MQSLILKWGIAAAIVLGCLFGAYRHGVNVTDDKWEKLQSDAQAAQATLRAEEERAARVKEQQRQADIEKIRADAQKQIQDAQADARDADAASDRLRKQADRLAKSIGSCPANPGAASGGQTGTNPSILLADLLSRADEEAGRMAALADRARAAGSACERAFDAIRNNQ